MIRKLMVIGLLLAFLTTTSFAFAEDVFATKRGKKYHTEECRLIKNKNAQAIDKKEAIEKGLTPCKRCYKEDIVVSEEEDK